jgi:hypothetical protein
MNQCSPEGSDPFQRLREKRRKRLNCAIASVLIVGNGLQLAVLVYRWTPYLVARFQGVEAALPGVSLRGANLRNVVLAGANLRGADLRHADLRGANLSGWYFPDGPHNACIALDSGADLRDAELSDADLRGADLGRAELLGANLTGANLAGTNLDRARYDARTRWPIGFDPRRHRAQRVK